MGHFSVKLLRLILPNFVEILNLKISKEVKKCYIDLNNTKIINLKNIKDIEIRTYFYQKKLKFNR